MQSKDVGEEENKVLIALPTEHWEFSIAVSVVALTFVELIREAAPTLLFNDFE